MTLKIRNRSFTDFNYFFRGGIRNNYKHRISIVSELKTNRHSKKNNHSEYSRYNFFNILVISTTHL